MLHGFQTQTEIPHYQIMQNAKSTNAKCKMQIMQNQLDYKILTLQSYLQSKATYPEK